MCLDNIFESKLIYWYDGDERRKFSFIFSGVTCVKWGTVYSAFFALTCGIRQGGVLSPYLFAVFIDGVVQRVQASGIGCYVKFICFNIILYADDILLLAPSVTALQQLLHVCETELACLDMAINVGKSACMRIGSRYNVKCMNISTLNSREILWCDKIKYLGIDLIAARVFKRSYDNAKIILSRPQRCI